MSKVGFVYNNQTHWFERSELPRGERMVDEMERRMYESYDLVDVGRITADKIVAGSMDITQLIRNTYKEPVHSVCPCCGRLYGSSLPDLM